MSSEDIAVLETHEEFKESTSDMMSKESTLAREDSPKSTAYEDGDKEDLLRDVSAATEDVEVSEPTVEDVEVSEPAAEDVEPTEDVVEEVSEPAAEDVEEVSEPAAEDVVEEVSEPAAEDVVEPTEDVEVLETTAEDVEPTAEDAEVPEAKTEDVEVPEATVEEAPLEPIAEDVPEVQSKPIAREDSEKSGRSFTKINSFLGRGMPTFPAPSASGTEMIKKKKKRKSQVAAGSGVFESSPVIHTADVTATSKCSDILTDQPSVFESNPDDSVAEFRASNPLKETVDKTLNSVFENAPEVSSAVFRNVDKPVDGAGETKAVFENTPMEASADTTARTKVSDIPETAQQSVFENEVSGTVADVVCGESEGEYVTDSEEE